MSLRNFRFDALKDAEISSPVVLERAEHNHLFRVLRARAGEVVGLLDGCGWKGIAQVEKGNVLTLLTKEHAMLPEKRIHLYIAPPRRQKMDSILKQAAELGVFRIVPVLCEYAVSEPGENAVAGRWRDLLFEACKQSANPYLPQIFPMIPFREALEDAQKNCQFLAFGSVRENGSFSFDSGDAAWFVGPEGGYSPEELAELEKIAHPIRLGSYILRVETAAIAGIAKLV
ncbi:MAG: 16S rRNA (uracil(1498)-N(3))-methyltransferase [Lentisphaeria bacterium]|nr:16S rRNA (uracil(1498)-N(3))-methyltransferase [Lentisphaeria bacterium]